VSSRGEPQTFSQRAAAHTRVSAFPSAAEPKVIAVADELLVTERLAELVGPDWLARQVQDRNAAPLTSFKEAVERGWSLRQREGTPRFGDAADVRPVQVVLDRDPDIFALTYRLRTTLIEDLVRLRPDADLDRLRLEAVHAITPNHVLIPAMESHGCPSGPPRPGNPHPIPPRKSPAVPVTVIDSGYQWNDAEWDENPLDGKIEDVEQALAFPTLTPDPLDIPDADGNKRLDVLAGHANFVAGIIAQQCENAEITIVNHNGGFAPKADNLPTEASVALSLALGGADVINVGFAFKSYDSGISDVWNGALNVIGPDVMVVAPAGNQGVMSERIPGALNTVRSGLHPNVIAVGSVSYKRNGSGLTPSSFSNRGPWVSCWAFGVQVESTFLRVNMKLEDDTSTDPDKYYDFTTNAWAKWSGTSFAAPQVAAAIASEMAANTGMSATEAWQSIVASTPETPGLGLVFPDPNP
jgi:Subtilase family